MRTKELDKALKEYGKANLKVGDQFQSAYSGLIFKILDIDHTKNWCKIYVYSPLNNYHFEEEWNDLHTVYQALSIGEYKLIN